MPPPRSTSKAASVGAKRRAPNKAFREQRGETKQQQHLKKQKTKFHREKFKESRQGAASHGTPTRPPHRDGAVSHRTKSIDLHLASKVSSDLRSDIARFKAKRAAVDIFGSDLHRTIFSKVPPPFIMQHLPEEVAAFRTYLPRFQSGAASHVDAFIAWFEWASYELHKEKRTSAAPRKQEATGEDEEKESDARAAKVSTARQVLAQTLKERAHMKALLQMCLRHNAAARREGQHALINHLKGRLSEERADASSLESLRATAHHSVLYALSRLVLGMATENLAMIVLHCHALFLVLSQTAITPSALLSLLDEELALSARMKVVQARLKHRRTDRGDVEGEEADEEDLVDPDDINDPTRGERNQRMTAAVFALGALVASRAPMSAGDAQKTAQFLSFCYVEVKSARVIAANVLFALMEHQPRALQAEDPMQWVCFAFFHYPKMEYYRPEGIQLLLRWMEADPKPSATFLPPVLDKYLHLDPLEPSTLEQITNALFRREQVTAVHPMVHPIWDDLFQLVVRRCAAGESMKGHLSTLVHTAIAPYRRGSADVPRRSLFQSLVTRLGQLAVQSEDAEERAEVLHMASKSAGYGRRTAAKATPLAELRQLPISALDRKVRDLLRQYRATRDSDPAALTNRTWVLRELRGCLYVPVRQGVECPYVDEAVLQLLEFGFFPRSATRDELSKNRCIYLFADVLSFTYQAALSRPKVTVGGLDIIQVYLAAEEKERTRYTTAVRHSAFRKARNRIVTALESSEQRSVLFYEHRDVEVLLTILFLILSVDDPSNPDAVAIAESIVPDLVEFYLHGTLGTLELLFDVLMALIMRVSAPLQVMPLMTCARRIATGFLLKFARFIRSKRTLDLILSPLREAYHTDSREAARRKKMTASSAADAEDLDESEEEIQGEEDEGDEDDRRSDGSEGEEASSSSSAASDAEGDVKEDSSTEAEDSDTESSDEGTDLDDDEQDSAEGAEEAVGEEEEEEEEDALGDEDALGEEEPPTQEYIDALKGMVGNIDLEHTYPKDGASKEKSDAVRAIQLAARVGLSMKSPLVIDVYQVLLAVCRENVKAADDVIFNSAVSSLEMLLMTKERYYGYFVPATDLFQLLADIQSFVRKLERALTGKDRVTAKAAASMRRRMGRLKSLALRVFHFLSALAYLNHAQEDTRITLAEYYKSIFCDRGWDMKKLLPGIKKDLYHYRRGFAWALLPAVLEKFEEVEALDGAKRVRVFTGCCTMIECMLSRLSGLPNDLKTSSGRAMGAFLQSVTLQQVYEMKHTLPYVYLHAVKMVLQYNSRVHMDTDWVSRAVVDAAVEDDALPLSAASIRLLSVMERLLHKTPRARETKVPVPVKVLYQQFDDSKAKEKGDFHRRAKKVRAKILKALLAHRNDDPTEEARALRRRRREELRVEDRLQRQVLREKKRGALTKEEREEKRRRILMAKQERIAKNRVRKQHLHEARKASFERWRQAKLAASAAAEDEEA